jgi:hypothetical protein
MRKLLFSIACIAFFEPIQAQISTQNLIAHYELDSGAYDISGNNLHGVNNNCIPTTNRFNKSNSAMYFNGINSHVLVPDDSLLRVLDSFSISLWYYQEARSNPGWTPLISKRYSFGSDPYDSYGISRYPNGTGGTDNWSLFVSNGSAGSLKSASSIAVPPLNEWKHVVGTFNRNTISLYIDGVLQNSTSKTDSIGYSDLGLYIGFNGVGINEYFKGKIDDVRIYGRVITPDEINTLYNYSPPTTFVADQHNMYKNNIILFPNPVSSIVNIKSDQNNKFYVQVFNSLGKMITSISDTNLIDLSMLEKGVYFIACTDEKGNKTTQRVQKY